MFCPKCGKQIDDDSVFCEFCGENVEEIPATDPFQTVYADDNAYNDDYTDNYADNYADEYNNAYPANFTEPEPMPNPAPEKSGKKMIAAVCAVCSVILVLMAVLCAKFIFGSKKIQTDDPSANSLAAAVTTTADSSSVVAEESSAAETAVTTAATTAATTAPAAESSSSKAEKQTKAKTKKNTKPELSGLDIFRMGANGLRDYVGNDYYVTRREYDGEMIIGITSDTYCKNIILKYQDSEADEEEVRRAFEGGENGEFGFPMLFDGALIGDGVRVGDKYSDMASKIDCVCGVDKYGNSFSLVDGERINMVFGMYGVDHNFDETDQNDLIDLSHTDSRCISASFVGGWGNGAHTIGKVVSTDDNAYIRNVPNADNSQSCRLWGVEVGKEMTLLNDEVIYENGKSWYKVEYYDVTHSNGDKTYKFGYIESKYLYVDPYQD